jgi:phosphate transport system protein
MSRRVGALPSPGPHPETRRMPVGRAGIHPVPAALEPELAGIRQLVVLMGEEVDRAIVRSVCGLVDGDVDVCSSVVEQSVRLHSLQRELRQLCLATVLERDPSAGRTREAVALLHMAAELGRIGDHCARIAHIGTELSRLPESGGDPGLTRMAEFCSEQVREVLLAVSGRDLLRARGLTVRDDRLERLCRRLLEGLAAGARTEPLAAPRATRMLAVARLLERIADRVVSIAEDLLLVDGGAMELTGLPAEAATGR